MLALYVCNGNQYISYHDCVHNAYEYGDGNMYTVTCNSTGRNLLEEQTINRTKKKCIGIGGRVQEWIYSFGHGRKYARTYIFTSNASEIEAVLLKLIPFV